MPSPPKPWERGSDASCCPTTASPAPALPSVPSASVDGSAAPAIPARTGTAGYTGAAAGAGMGTMTRTGYGAGYGGYGTGYGGGYGAGTGYGTGYSSYSSPYNRYGTGNYSRFGSTYGGGMYGSTYGTAYGGYGGYAGGGGSMYGQRFGQFGDPNDPSLMNRMEQSTAGTFHMLESVVGTFGGLAQMLESTYMATHSSFMAMIGVAEQFGHLRNYLGQVLSVFALLRALRRFGYWIIGRRAPVDASAISAAEFEAHDHRATVSRRPILVFLAAVIGIPWLISRIIRAADRRRREQGGNDPQAPGVGANGQVLNPSELEFARALYDFQGDHAAELSLRQGDLIAILSRHDAQGQPSQWWRGRMRDGRIGLFPANYVEILEK
ncbi:Peroxin 13, N-terminal region-domain-containing protein, partial [Thamnocephalis sphaerospora]